MIFVSKSEEQSIDEDELPLSKEDLKYLKSRFRNKFANTFGIMNIPLFSDEIKESVYVDIVEQFGREFNIKEPCLKDKSLNKIFGFLKRKDMYDACEFFNAYQLPTWLDKKIYEVKKMYRIS